MNAALVVLVALLLLVIVARRAEPTLRAYARWRIRRAAERRWKAYARRHGLDWRTLTPQQKLAAHMPEGRDG